MTSGVLEQAARSVPPFPLTGYEGPLEHPAIERVRPSPAAGKGRSLVDAVSRPGTHTADVVWCSRSNR